MKYLVAVSGGVDSVVLLDMLAKKKVDAVVAHVDHGIRDDSADDARFVRQLAQQYGYEYREKALHLGPTASEERAREARYTFLYELAKEYGATIVTAHHGNDLVETIAINLHRGTGWRGLAVLSRKGTERPLLNYSKTELYAYAMTNKLEWVEDKTNRDRRYLRNQIRARISSVLSDNARRMLRELRDKQVALVGKIEEEAESLVSQRDDLRHMLTQVDQAVAIELLGTYIVMHVGVRPTRPQLERALIAVKTAKQGATCHVGSGVLLRFKSRVFSVEML